MCLSGPAGPRGTEFGQTLHRCPSLSICQAVGVPWEAAIPNPLVQAIWSWGHRGQLGSGSFRLWPFWSMAIPGWKGWYAEQVIGFH